MQLGLTDSLRVLSPYAKRNFLSQIEGIWFIVAYLVIFQILVLKLPIQFAGMIAAGILVVAVGLMFFMEGLRLGLMPLGEVIGSVLPRKSGVPLILLFAFMLGVGATFAEPAIAVLKAAGSTLEPTRSPLLYSMLNEFSGQLVAAVGIGVGVAVALGVLRFFFAWPLKNLAIPATSILLLLSALYAQVPELNDVLGLAWDSGAVTTGPVTVPLVLALGIGVCRVVSIGSGSSGHSGFGIVTLASLFPILAVLLLSGYHYHRGDFYGGENYRGDLIAEADRQTPARKARTEAVKTVVPITTREYALFAETGQLPDGFEVSYNGGTPVLRDGQIVIEKPEVVIAKPYKRQFAVFGSDNWSSDTRLSTAAVQAILEAFRAIIPLCLFLYVVLRLLRQGLGKDNDVGLGVVFSVVGMALFGLGIALGLTPLGGQLGSNIPIAFASIVPWGAEYPEPALLSDGLGRGLAIGFAFFLGYGATLAEPALNALGQTVEKITAGAFRKKLLMQSVAIGVGGGIAAGVVKMTFGLSLMSLLIPAYALVLILTSISPNSFVNFGWDSAGVTTGPITVPLVLAMGLGIGANVPGVSDGFGILALASVGPILSVLTVGLYTQAINRQEQPEGAADDQGTTAVETGVTT